MKVEIDPDKCIGSGQCVLAAPEVFDQREDDGTVVLLDATPSPSQWEATRTAAAHCPAGVIALSEE